MTWTLQSHGTHNWEWLQTHTAEFTCAWADTRGFHIGDCPVTQPSYSHLWAWSGDAHTLIRARLDTDTAIIGVLTDDGTGLPDPTRTEQVQVRIEAAHTWGHDDKRISRQPAGVLPGQVATYIVHSPMPITFIGPTA